MNMDFESHLNAAQMEAVLAVEGPVLVVAGAGSGKTRVIEYRVLNLLRSGVPPESVLLLTFTRRAAREMLARAARHDPRCAGVAGGTFHSFANGVLRRYGSVLGLPPSFTILDQADAEEAVGRCAARLGCCDASRRFPGKETLLSVISKATNQRATVKAVLARDYPHFAEHAGRVEAVRQAYTEFKVRSDCLDYDDLLVYLLILLEQEPVRRQLAERHRYVMVDEYQDTNALQGDVTHLLAQGHRNVMAVGDDAQSIYRFRGASRENILEFPARYPGCRVVKLEKNYRSTGPVLALANAVLEGMVRKHPKYLRPVRGDDAGRPQLVRFKDDQDEAEWVADRVKRLRDEGVPLSRQGVLYRSSHMSIRLQVALRARGIPFDVFGGLRFSETAHVKDVLAHLKVLLNPRDELAWNRVLRLLAGVGSVTADRLSARAAGATGMGGATEALLTTAAPSKAAAAGLVRLCEALRRAATLGAPGPMFQSVLEYYEPLLRDHHDGWPGRLEDLNSLREIAGGYCGLAELLSDFSLEPPERSVARAVAAADDEKPLTLSTIHSAKGLEWEAVFLVGVRDGALPSAKAMRDEEDVEEERRLLYVAVTRARTHLFLTVAHQGNEGGVLHRLSRFLEPQGVTQLLDCESGTGRQSPAPGTPDDGLPVLGRDSLLRRLREHLGARGAMVAPGRSGAETGCEIGG
jgi:DNA helicase-2/ATP-dependent DNA helicase PcrA